MPSFEITREIGIDAGHRVPDHGSKCRNLHGHRYTIQATVAGELAASGEESGMVMDFGFLKDVMMYEIDDECDHGMILSINDPWVKMLVPEINIHRITTGDFEGKGRLLVIRAKEQDQLPSGKFYIVPFIPTAENLARHWFERMREPVNQRTNGRGLLTKVRVWETPNCFADYPA